MSSMSDQTPRGRTDLPSSLPGRKINITIYVLLKAYANEKKPKDLNEVAVYECFLCLAMSKAKDHIVTQCVHVHVYGHVWKTNLLCEYNSARAQDIF